MLATLMLRGAAARSLAAKSPALRSTAFKSAAALKSPFSTSASRRLWPPAPKTWLAHRVAPGSSPSTAAAAARNAGAGARRTYMQVQPSFTGPPPSTLRKLATAGLVFGGSLIALNVVFNRETRDDGGMPLFEREYLNQTFMHTGLGIGIIALSARKMVQSGFVYRLMATNPWVVGLGGLALGAGAMIGTRMIDPDNYIPKYALWTAFNVTQAAMVAPMIAFFPPALLARAGLYTVAMMGSLAFVGATAKQDKYLYIGGPLLAGLGVVLVSGFAPLILPATAVRTLALTDNIWLWGGMAVMGGFTLHHVQVILHHARLAESGQMKRDPVNESIGLELDFLNIFIRMVQILAMQGNKRK